MNKPIVQGMALAVVVVLIGAGTVLAQGGGPAVDWWVIAGGGGPSSGGSVFLNDTLGQPVVGPASGSGDVAHSAGYWTRCVAAAAGVSAVAVTRDGNDVVLTWGTDPNSAQYRVWIATDPYFDPDNPGDVTPVLWPASPYRDTGAAASLENHFYVLRGLNACGAASASSGRVGEFTFGLTPGTP